MNIRAKLTVLFSLLVLLPLIVLSIFSYILLQGVILQNTELQLRSLSDVQQLGINDKLDRYLEQVKLVTSRTQLRLSLRDFNDQGDAVDRVRIEGIILDARDAVRDIKQITVYDPNGNLIASTQSLDNVPSDVSGEQYFIEGKEANSFHDLIRDENNILRARLAGPLVIEGELVGVVDIVASSAPILSISEDYSSLGDTGELFLVKRSSEGDAVFLNPLRFDSGAVLSRAVSKDQPNSPAIYSIQRSSEVVFDQDAVDYRGEHVFAVARYIEALDWGLVVKIDRSEVLEPINRLAIVYGVIFVLTVFGSIVLTYLMSRQITKPILKLVDFSKKLQSGDLGDQLEIERKDEIGILADALNDSAQKLDEFYESLEDKVVKRTRQLAESQAKDEAVLLSLGDGLVVTDNEGKIVLVNQKFEEMLGHVKEDVYGKKLSSVIPMFDEDDRVIVEGERLITRTLKTDSISVTHNQETVKYGRKDGSTFPVAITVSPILLNGKSVGAVEVFRDITTEKEIDKAKTEFVSLASHQLRTPLSAINWYSEMMVDGDIGDLNPQQQKFMDEIYKANQRMIDLVNALLNVSRIELGTFIVEPKPTNVVKLAEDISDELLPKIKEKKLTFNLDFPDDIPKIDTDPRLLGIVFQNLLSNAVKYTHEGGTVSLEGSVGNGGESFGSWSIPSQSLCLKFTDTGIGIPEDQHEKIFTKLFRADNVKKEDTDGTGLGLYIVKSIVENSGGRVWFDSAQGKGTTFYVVLPMSGMKERKGTRRLE